MEGVDSMVCVKVLPQAGPSLLQTSPTGYRIDSLVWDTACHDAAMVLNLSLDPGLYVTLTVRDLVPTTQVLHLGSA